MFSLDVAFIIAEIFIALATIIICWMFRHPSKRVHRHHLIPDIEEAETAEQNAEIVRNRLARSEFATKLASHS